MRTAPDPSNPAPPGKSVRVVGPVAFFMTAAGVILAASLNISFLILVAAGAFGPGILRQFRVLKYGDEFHRQAVLTAGYRAFLVAGTYAVLILVSKPWMELGSAVEAGKTAADSILLVLLMTYVLSYLFDFWGVRKAAFRILMTMGAGLLAYIAAVGLLYDFQPSEVLEGAAWTVPMIALALLSRRHPRSCGGALLLLTVSIFLLTQFNPAQIPAMARVYRILLLLPLMASGIGLLTAGREMAHE